MMFEYEIDIMTEMFLGILEEEKKRRNRVRILIHYSSSERPDYSDIYAAVIDITDNKHYGYIEDCAKHIHSMLQQRFNLKELTICIEKIAPLYMDRCQLVRITYGP